jgi:hypothetical protein
VRERHGPHLEPGVADQPEPRRTREQAADVFVEGGTQTTPSAEALPKARGWPVPVVPEPKAAKRKAEPEAKASMPKAGPWMTTGGGKTP